MTTNYAYDELRPMHISAASNLMNQFTSKERDAYTRHNLSQTMPGMNLVSLC